MPSSKPRRKSRKLASRPPKNGKSPLMSAPPEVRMRIYRYLFQGARFIIRQKYNPPYDAIVKFTPATARRCGILVTCKTFRQEAQPILGDKMHLGLWLRGRDIPTTPPVFNDVYFPRLKSLELANFDVDLTKFPNLEILYWNHMDLMSEPLGWPDGFREFLKSSDIELFLPHLIGEQDPSFVEAFMKEFSERFAEEIAAAEAATQNGEHVDLDSETQEFWQLVKAVRSKDPQYRVATKHDFNLILTSLDGGAYGKSISLLLRLHFDMATQEILSRHLREIVLDDYDWPFVWDEDFDSARGCWPAQGMLPDIDINVDPMEYIQKRLEVPTLPESASYVSDIPSTESSESDPDAE